MIFTWNEQTLRWFEEASEYTGYNRNLAELLLPYLEGCRSICDIGCGMALVDFELADKFDRVICIDNNETVIRYVRQRAEELGHPDFRAITADGMDRETISGEKGPVADAVLAIFHGDVEMITLQYLSYASKKLILIVHGNAFGSTGPAKYRIRKCCDTEHTRAWLEKEGIPYTFQSGELEFGQPHRSLEEAIAFTKVFSKGAPEDELKEYVKQHVTETGRTDYPLYTPKKKSFGIFVIDAKKVRSCEKQTSRERFRTTNSAGAFVFRDTESGKEVLMVRGRRGWGFPKGHIEPGESAEEAAIREVFEETGIKIELTDGFSAEVSSALANEDRKIIYFYGNAKGGSLSPQLSEVIEASWIDVSKAAACLHFEEDRNAFLECINRML